MKRMKNWKARKIKEWKGIKDERKAKRNDVKME